MNDATERPLEARTLADELRLMASGLDGYSDAMIAALLREAAAALAGAAPPQEPVAWLVELNTNAKERIAVFLYRSDAEEFAPRYAGRITPLVPLAEPADPKAQPREPDGPPAASGERPTEIEIELAMEAVHDRLHGAGAWEALDLSARITMLRTVAHLLNAQPTDRLAGERAPAQPAREAEGLRERLEDLDDCLSFLESRLHGPDGDSVTATRGMLHKAIDALTAAAPAQTPCNWREDEDGGWRTDCSQLWIFPTDGPVENNMRYCHFCGRPIRATPAPEPPPFVGYHGCCGRRLDLGHKPDCPSTEPTPAEPSADPGASL